MVEEARSRLKQRELETLVVDIHQPKAGEARLRLKLQGRRYYGDRYRSKRQKKLV